MVASCLPKPMMRISQVLKANLLHFLDLLFFLSAYQLPGSLGTITIALGKTRDLLLNVEIRLIDIKLIN